MSATTVDPSAGTGSSTLTIDYTKKIPVESSISKNTFICETAARIFANVNFDSSSESYATLASQSVEKAEILADKLSQYF